MRLDFQKSSLFIFLLSAFFTFSTFAKEPSHSAAAGAKTDSSHSTSHKEEKKSVEPDVALGFLRNGNARFIKGFLRKDGASATDRSRLDKGQNPHAIVLSCSDSRVPPELVFDQKLGEIFTVRTAGESLDANAIGSIEYAIEHLGSRLIVVMGHTRCGAVKAALSTLEGGDAGSPSLNSLVADLHPRLQSFKKKTPSEDLSTEVWANTKGVAKDLSSKSEIIANAIKSGKVKVVSALYHLGSGTVDWE